MCKRQDTRKGPACLFLVTMTAIILSLLPACQPAPKATVTETLPTALQNTAEPSSPPKSSATTTLAPPTPVLATPSITFTPTPDCRQRGGERVEQVFFSEELNTSVNVTLYLPPCYAEGTQDGFPVLYLLHGLSYTNEQWLRLGLAEHMDALIASGKIPPFIVVLPEEARSEPPQISPFAAMITQELISWMDSNYATRPEKAFRGIGGLSRGAAWAVRIGFDHPSLFCCVGAHSLPLFQADGARINRWLTQTSTDDLPRVFIDIGRDDREWPSAQDFANQLDAAHVPHEWYLFKFGHTETYWASHLDLYLTWYAKNW